jgi:hypothetical protein
MVFDYVEKGGNIADLINPVAKLDAYILSDDEYKVRFALNDGSLTEDEIEERVSNLIDNGKLSTAAQEYTVAAQKIRTDTLKGHISSFEQIKEAERASIIERQKQENQQLIDTVNQMTEYKGYEIKDENKQYIISQIKSGQLHRELNNAQSQITAYLELKLGDKIAKMQSLKLKDVSRESHNKVLEDEAKKRHNIPPAKSTGNVATQGKRDGVNRWDFLKDVEG